MESNLNPRLANLENARRDLDQARALVAAEQRADGEAAELVRRAQEVVDRSDSAILKSDGGEVIERLAAEKSVAAARLDALRARHMDRRRALAEKIEAARGAEAEVTRATLEFERKTVAELGREFDERITRFANDAIASAAEIGGHVQAAARALASIPFPNGGPPPGGSTVTSLFTTRGEILAAFDAAWNSAERAQQIAEHEERSRRVPVQAVGVRAGSRTITPPVVWGIPAIRDEEASY